MRGDIGAGRDEAGTGGQVACVDFGRGETRKVEGLGAGEYEGGEGDAEYGF